MALSAVATQAGPVTARTAIVTMATLRRQQQQQQPIARTLVALIDKEPATAAVIAA